MVAREGGAVASGPLFLPPKGGGEVKEGGGAWGGGGGGAFFEAAERTPWAWIHLPGRATDAEAGGRLGERRGGLQELPPRPFEVS